MRSLLEAFLGTLRDRKPKCDYSLFGNYVCRARARGRLCAWKCARRALEPLPMGSFAGLPTFSSTLSDSHWSVNTEIVTGWYCDRHWLELCNTIERQLEMIYPGECWKRNLKR
jgi:hypothetical protein